MTRIAVFHSFPPPLEQMHLLPGFAVCFVTREDGDPGAHNAATGHFCTQRRFIKVFVVKPFPWHDTRFSDIKGPLSEISKQPHNFFTYLCLLHQYVRDACAVPRDIHRVRCAVLGSERSKIVCIDLGISHHGKTVQVEKTRYQKVCVVMLHLAEALQYLFSFNESDPMLHVFASLQKGRR